jgi:hypothetical protein
MFLSGKEIVHLWPEGPLSGRACLKCGLKFCLSNHLRSYGWYDQQFIRGASSGRGYYEGREFYPNMTRCEDFL